jgi:uncharacterized protein (DUF952 family)
MSVIVHIAARDDWERARSAGAYTTASLHNEGYVHCASATQHATVANARFAARTDLVLLLIDTDKLSSEVRFEQPDTGGDAFPHVYGPVDLAAVFEAAPYQPGPDGQFHPYEEASGWVQKAVDACAAAAKQAVLDGQVQVSAANTRVATISRAITRPNLRVRSPPPGTGPSAEGGDRPTSGIGLGCHQTNRRAGGCSRSWAWRTICSG